LEDFNLFTILKDLFLLFYLFQWAKYIEKKNRKKEILEMKMGGRIFEVYDCFLVSA